MFQGLRIRLLLSYVIVMEIILICFSGGIYFLFSRSLSRQLDNKLIALAEIIAPTYSIVKHQGNQYFSQLSNENLFDAQTQSIELFDSNKRRLASYGEISVPFAPQPGLLTVYSRDQSLSDPIRTVTLSVAIDRSSFDQSSLQGYVRISQSLTELKTEKQQLLLHLSSAIIATLGLVTLGGFWLTEKAVKPIEQGVQQQKQFTADASHELRNPLTAIKASIEIMRRHPERFQAKDVRKVNAIASATEQMVHLVEDLLFLARTDAAKRQSNLEWNQVSLNELLQNLVDFLDPLAQEKEITLEYQDYGPALIMGNQGQINRLFSNLVHNALNYTPANGVVIIRLLHHNRVAKIIVEDTGIGIASEDLPHLFDRFWRADKVRHRSEGSGLGLSIAQAIATSHRGNITVDSQVGVGTSFIVNLPTIGS